eukprot:6255606-Prymnesium_polylepis.1
MPARSRALTLVRVCSAVSGPSLDRAVATSVAAASNATQATAGPRTHRPQRAAALSHSQCVCVAPRPLLRLGRSSSSPALDD